MDQIRLSGLRACGRHGANPGERDRDQPFDLDVVVHIDLDPARTSDDLAQTIDYAALRGRLIRVVASTSFSLLERLAGELLNEIFKDPRVARAEVAIAKPEAFAHGVPSVTLDRVNPNYRSKT